MTTSFELDCTDCAFRTTIDGDFSAAIDAIDEHRETVGAEPDEHFVNVHRRGSNV